MLSPDFPSNNAASSGWRDISLYAYVTRYAPIQVALRARSERQTISIMASCRSKTVVSLKEFPFIRRTNADKMTTKLLGPPRPNLNIKQAAVKGGKSYNRRFSRSLWTTTGVTDMHHLAEKVKRHEASKIHMDSYFKFSTIG
uniref:Si:ch211-240b21.2 n=1 Tax=Nothobranchius furzeri TaxID=105023 RepID=A0A1A7ZUV4_NOTFU